MRKRSQPRHNQLRKGRRSIPGAYYSITLSTQNRDPQGNSVLGVFCY